MKKWLLLFLFAPTFLFAQWSTSQLSEAKFYTQAASAMGKALFIGGVKLPGPTASKRVEIYDFANPGWTIRMTQNGTVLAGVVVADSLLFIAGGQNPQTGAYYKLVEIYDVKNDVWKPSQNLSVARTGIAAVRVGSELWFAGGNIQTSATDFTFYDVIDVYNLQTGSWTTRHLSTPRFCSSAFLDGKVVFAGGSDANGPVAMVDIYDTTTQQWTNAQLSVPRFNVAVTTAGPYVLFAGGSTYIEDALDVVDIWNAQTNTWTTATLSQPRTLIGAATVCGTTAIFAGGGEAKWSTQFLTTSSNRVDIFDATTGEWSQDSLSQARTAAFAASDGTHFFMGAGWNPENSQFVNSVEIYTCESMSAVHSAQSPLVWEILPNPTRDALHLQLPDDLPTRVEILNTTGQVLSVTTATKEIALDVQQLLPGMYLLRIKTTNGQSGLKRWVKM